MPPDPPERLRAGAAGRPVGVDRARGVLLGYVVAQLGPFKSRGRGEFDEAALHEIARLGNATKMRARFSHPTECDDGLGKYLGRPQNFAVGTAVNADGVTVPAVRADLHFDPTALDTPPGGGKPLGRYVMDLAESDPDALSSSLVLRATKEYRRKPDGTLDTDADGTELPPLWRPQRLTASDIVDTGDAVDGLLSAGLPNDHLWRGAELLDGLFAGLGRGDVEGRLRGFLDRYLAHRFGGDAGGDPAPAGRTRRQKVREQAARAG